MRFRRKYDIYDKSKRDVMTYGFWTPTAREYEEIIEDYLRISRIRKNNKLAILKLQLHLLGDQIAHQNLLDSFKKELEKQKRKKGEDVETIKTIKYIEREIFSHELIVRNLKDIADGIAWRFFNYNRALLYYLGDNPDVGPARQSVGLKYGIKTWGDEYAYGQKKAILNALTNVVRIGDITVFEDDNSIEFIEVKSSGSQRGQKRKSRLERQKEKLDETIRFFNTGITKFDGKVLNIKNMPIQPKYRFDLLQEVINEAMKKGVSHTLIEDYLLIECADFRTKKTSKEIISYCKSNSEPIRDKWRENGDRLYPLTFLSDRLDFSKNLTPISIWPLSDKICATLMMGGLTITFSTNISEIQRKFIAAGWEISNSIFDLKGDDLKSLKAENTQYFITLKKGAFYIEVPPALIGRCIFEFLSPDTLIESFEWAHKNTPLYQSDEYVLPNFRGEKDIWD